MTDCMFCANCLPQCQEILSKTRLIGTGKHSKLGRTLYHKNTLFWGAEHTHFIRVNYSCNLRNSPWIRYCGWRSYWRTHKKCTGQGRSFMDNCMLIYSRRWKWEVCESVNPCLKYRGNLWKGHRQTVQTQIRRHTMWRLIRVYIVCQQDFPLKIE